MTTEYTGLFKNIHSTGSSRGQNTLLARLGGADPDRKTPEHDLACRYLLQEDVGLQVLARLKSEEVRDLCSFAEVPLLKGSGQYTTTVGFLDVVYSYESGQSFVMDGQTHVSWYRNELFIEVKTADPGIGALLRQVNLYRQDGYGIGWDRKWITHAVVATTFVPTEEWLADLEHAGVAHLYLGAGYEAWKKQRSTKVVDRQRLVEL